MKKIFFLVAVTAAASTVFISITNAQIAKTDLALKALSVFITEPTIGNSFEPIKNRKTLWGTISIKALRNFKTSFEGAANEKWFITANGFIVKFSLDNNSSRASYDKKGNWKYTLQQYAEDKLPIDVRKLIKTSYYDHQITLVEDIDILAGGKYYLVHMQDANSWTNVLVHNNELMIMETLNKS